MWWRIEVHDEYKVYGPSTPPPGSCTGRDRSRTSASAPSRARRPRQPAHCPSGFALNFESDARRPRTTKWLRDKRLGLGGPLCIAHHFRCGRDGTLLGDACRADKDQQIRAVLFPEHPVMPPGCTIKGKLAVRARVNGNVGVYHVQGYAVTPARPSRIAGSARGRCRGRGIRKAYNCRTKGK